MEGSPKSEWKAPSNNERCKKNDGKLWRCSSWRMEGKTYCNRHFLKQVEYQNKKKNIIIINNNHLPPHQLPTKKKRKTPLGYEAANNNNNNNNKKKKKKEDSDDDSLEKLFDGYPSENEDDSIEKLFEDNWTSDSDADSCQPTSKANVMSSGAQLEPMEELKKNQEETPAPSAR